MFFKDTHKNAKNSWGRRGIRGALVVLIAGISLDYGKHWTLKRALENEIAKAGDLISVESISVSPWPLFQNHLVLKNFNVNVAGTPLSAANVSLRQGWQDWQLAHVLAKDVKSAQLVSVQEVQGILDTGHLSEQVKVSKLVLTDIKAKLPLISFSGAYASFEFLYEMGPQRLALKTDAPEMSFPNGATFGLNGEGVIHTKAPINGKMDLKIKNIDKMLRELVAAGVVKESQASMIMTGSDLLSKIGLHDLSLPLTIQDGEVFLGPIPLFKV